MQSASFLPYLLGALAILGILLLSRSSRKENTSNQPAPDYYAFVFYGDSSKRGGYFEYTPEPTLRHYDPDPVQMIANRLGVPCLNKSINGLQMQEFMIGGEVTMAVEGIGTPGQAIPTAREQLATVPAHNVVLCLGHVDAMFTHRMIEDFATLVNAFLDMAINEFAKNVIIHGLVNFKPSDAVTPFMLERRAQFDAFLRQVATERGLTYIDANHLHPEPCQDKFHPTYEGHLMLADNAVPYLRKYTA